ASGAPALRPGADAGLSGGVHPPQPGAVRAAWVRGDRGVHLRRRRSSHVADVARARRSALTGMAVVHRLRYVDPYRPRGRLYRAVCRFSISKLGMWLAEKVAWKLDPHVLRLTRGRLASTGPVASGLLETR